MKQKILVGVITCLRPIMLSSLLESLTKLRLAEAPFGVVLAVVDNDAAESARDTFLAWKERLPFPAVYLTEPQRGIPFARNKVLDYAIADGADFVAFIDDDETAPPDWLIELHRSLSENLADAVQGPVEFVAEPGSPAWMVADLAHRSTKMREQPEATAKSRLSTRNLLMSIRLATELGLRFDPRFALSGGSDVDYFYRAHLQGAKTIWTNRACVKETIPRARMELKAQLLRSFRSAAGTAWSVRHSRGAVTALAKTLPKVVETLFVGLAILLGRGWFGRQWQVAALRKLAACVGHVAGLFGLTGAEYREIKGY